MKIVVFDLDETLGYFTDLGMFLDCLSKTLNNRETTQEEFNQILDFYPEFIRPNIIAILNYLKTKKKSRSCIKVMIYTNNQGPKKWAEQLISYFETKINYKLFDQIVCAFKINGRQIEMNRTTHEKTHSDFIKCTKLPKNAHICYLDDVFFPEMVDDNIYYIHLKPYTHELSLHEMQDRFVKSDLGIKMKLDELIMKDEYNVFEHKHTRKSVDDMEIDVILGKEIMLHLKIFFGKAEPTFGKAEPTFVKAEPTFGKAEPTFGKAEPTFDKTFGKAEPTKHDNMRTVKRKRRTNNRTKKNNM